MIDKLARLIVAIALLVIAVLAAIVVRINTRANAFKTERDTLLNDSIPQLLTLVRDGIDRSVSDSASMTAALDSIEKLEVRVTRTLISNAILRDSAQILRELQLGVPLVPSVPGEPATVGDTLTQCRAQLTLCSQRAQLETQRADSLGTVLFETNFQLGALRGDIEVWKRHSAQSTSLLEYTERQLLDVRRTLAAAEPPCRGFLMKCPSRTRAALLASAATLAIVSTKPEQRYIAIALAGISLRF